MLSSIYQLIKQRLTTECSFKEVDWFMNQYAQLKDENTLFTTPAAYIQFAPINTTSLHSGNIQQLEISLDIHVVHEAWYDNDQRITALKHLQAVESVYKSLQNWNAFLSSLDEYADLKGTENDKLMINSIVRTSLTPDHSLSNLLITLQRFSFIAYDYSATVDFSEIIANLVVQVTN